MYSFKELIAHSAGALQYTDCFSTKRYDFSSQRVAQLAGAVEYTDCFFAEG